MNSLHEAKSQFKSLYNEKSGNMWESRDRFVKVPGRMYPIDVDYGEEETQKFDIVEAESKLHPSVQDLIKMIFDVNSMKKLMLEFELDTEKMPLGKFKNCRIKLRCSSANNYKETYSLGINLIILKLFKNY